MPGIFLDAFSREVQQFVVYTSGPIRYDCLKLPGPTDQILDFTFGGKFSLDKMNDGSGIA